MVEEIQAEGLVRNLPGFAKFIELVGYTNGQMLNFANISRDIGIDAKTVKEYYQILVDTLIGYYVEPYHKKVKRDLIHSMPKFYLFDVGVANHLRHRNITVLKGDEAGDAFEHYILMELKAYLGLKEMDSPVNYWRSKSGLEVDFVLGQGKIALETKISSHIDTTDSKGLIAFCEDYQPDFALVVFFAPRKRIITTIAGIKIEILPWQDFLEALWQNQYSLS